MSLDKISNFLSYTDCIPLFNIPSGIVHLTCDVRDRTVGKPNAPAPKDESLVALSARLLDDWSHLTKGLLIISIVGSIVLIIEAIWRHFILCEIASIKKLYPGNIPDSLSTPRFFPEKLLNNAEFIKAAKNHGLSIEEVMTDARKDDKNLIIDLIQSGQLSKYSSISNRLQNDRTIALEFVKKSPTKFDQLPDLLRNSHAILLAAKTSGLNEAQNDPWVFNRLADPLKNDVAIIKATINCKEGPDTPEEILLKVPDKNVLKMDEDDLLIRAVKYGIFQLNDLYPKFRDDRRYAIAALYADFSKAPIYMTLPLDSKQFNLLTEARQRDYTVHEAVVKELYPEARKLDYIEWLYQKVKIVMDQAKQSKDCPTLNRLALQYNPNL